MLHLDIGPAQCGYSSSKERYKGELIFQIFCRGTSTETVYYHNPSCYFIFISNLRNLPKWNQRFGNFAMLVIVKQVASRVYFQ